MTTALVKSLGLPRVLVGGCMLAAGAFFMFALSQAGHFGWGFWFLDAALRFALLAPVVLLVDTVLAVAQLIAGRREEHLSQRRLHLLLYLVVVWVLWGLYFLVVS